MEILIVRLVPDTPVESSQAVRFPWKLREKYKLQHVEAERRLSGSDTLLLLRFWDVSFDWNKWGKKVLPLVNSLPSHRLEKGLRF